MKKIWAIILMISAAPFLIAAAPNPAPEPETLFLYEKNDLYGYMNRQGYPVIPPKFRVARQFREELAAVARTVGKSIEYVDYIDNQGKVVISDNRFHAQKPYGFRPFHEGIAVADTGRGPAEHLLIDKKGNLIVNRVFPGSLSNFSEGFATYSKIRSSAAPVPGYERMIQDTYLNMKGEPATDKQFDYANSFSNGLAVVGRWKDGDIDFVTGDMLYAVIDHNFQFVTGYRFEDAGSYHDGLLPVMVGGKWGYIDEKGNQIIACQYDPYVGPEGVLATNLPGLLDFYLRDADWKDPYDFSEGFASVYKDGKWGYINTSGKLVIPFQFELARPFSEGVAAVKQDGRWGFIDQSGKVVIPYQYAYVLNCQDGLIVVGDQKGDYQYYIDQSGKIVKNQMQLSR